MTQLVEFGIVRNKAFGYYSEYLAPVDYYGAVVQAVLYRHRSAYGKYNITAAGFAGDEPDCPFGGIKESFLQKKVAAGISCNAKLRKYGKLNLFLGKLHHGVYYCIGIIIAIRYSYLR